MELPLSIRRNARHIDIIDVALLFILVIGIIIAVAADIALFPPPNTPTDAILILTGLTAFYGQYRLRHPVDEPVPSMRPTYDSQYMAYGLKNYGPGPALYIQLKVTVSDDDFDGRRILSPHEPPVHLEEGEFYPISDNERLTSLIENVAGDQYLRFHYSFVSRWGIREPIHLHGIADRPDDSGILSDEHLTDDPRRIRVKKYHEYSFDK